MLVRAIFALPGGAREVTGDVRVATVTLRLAGYTCQRLKQLVASRGISLNQLLEELGAAALAAHDAEARFRAMAGRRSPAGNGGAGPTGRA